MYLCSLIPTWLGGLLYHIPLRGHERLLWMCVHLPQQHHPSQHTTTHSLTCWYSDGDDGDSGFSTHPRSEGILRCFWYLQSDSRTVYWGDLRLFLCLPIRPLIIVVYAHYWRGSYQNTNTNLLLDLYFSGTCLNGDDERADREDQRWMEIGLRSLPLIQR